MVINIENLTKTYDGKVKILDGLNLSVSQGELITILGPSGCGKTTLLKIVNKLIEYDTGKVEVKGKDLSDWDTIELRRNTGYVIQQIGLFPHMTIEENISYVLSLQDVSKGLRRKRAEELIKLVGMGEDMLLRYPVELSGGQNQRIGVARALAAEPDIILMDEPFGAVDEIARTALQDEFIKLHEQLNSTILFVTHDILEALKLGNRIVLMNNGKIEQVGTREELIFKPANQFVKEFIGIKGFKSVL
ncbi:MAG: ATP-binding cassette domain-containing protein, partial [Peptostreptococcaceae bacterium]|nr:ATP-binding cassette domain-containing protein [Peptostreptococcaceae bacterium]